MYLAITLFLLMSAKISSPKMLLYRKNDKAKDKGFRFSETFAVVLLILNKTIWSKSTKNVIFINSTDQRKLESSSRSLDPFQMKVLHEKLF